MSSLKCPLKFFIHIRTKKKQIKTHSSVTNDFHFHENGSVHEVHDEPAIDLDEELANLNVVDPEEDESKPPTPPSVQHEVTFADEVDAVEAESVAEEPIAVAAVRPTNFQHNKQHTGLKNMSTGVNWCVTPTTKMEFDQEENVGFGSVKINRPIGVKATLSPCDNESVDSRDSNGSKTDQGHLDLKFYHNRLW